MDLELQLRAAEARKYELERAHTEALQALRGCSADLLEARQSRVRELEKKVALETVRYLLSKKLYKKLKMSLN